MTGSHKQITGFVARFFSMTGLAAERQAAVSVGGDGLNFAL